MNCNKEKYETIKKLYSIHSLVSADENWPNDINRALKCLNENIFKQSFNVASMKIICRIPQKNFSSRFKYYVGLTPVSYIKYHRVHCSKKIIDKINQEVIINENGFYVGYEFPSTFSNSFKSIIGVYPNSYLGLKK